MSDDINEDQTEMTSNFCCVMRRKFLIGIMAEDKSIPMPTEAVDCIDFGDGSEVPCIHIKFCPFCGVIVKGTRRVAK